MAMAKDPVCGMDVQQEKAAAKTQHQGQTYYFCSPGCKEKFDRQPHQYLFHEQGQKRKTA